MIMVDKVSMGGLMRCCLETIGDLYPDGPAKVAREGQRLQCKYAAGDPLHRMIFTSGTWQWDRERVMREVEAMGKHAKPGPPDQKDSKGGGKHEKPQPKPGKGK